MADPVPTAPAAPAPAPVPAPAPAAPASPALPVAAPEPVPAAAPATPAPAPAQAASGEPAPAVASPEPSAPAPTLLEKFDQEKAEVEAAKKPPDGSTGATGAAKPAEPAKPGATGATGEAPPAPAQGATAAAPSAPVEYKYTLPESMKMDDALKSEVHKAFDEFRANPSEGAQKLVDLHDKTMRDYAQFLAQEQHRVFAETRQNWAKKVLSDSEIGGSGHQTAMGAIARMRDMLVPEKERPAFEEFLRVTGAGDHPQFLKLLHQAARYYDEPTLPPPNARPTADNGKRPSTRLRDMYRENRDGRP